MPTPEIDYSDVQGTILRGYRVDLARHFILRITDAVAAGEFIGNLVNGTGGVPRITTARRWKDKPDCFVNISFTAPGLAALGVTEAQLQSFDPAFLAGATSDGVASVVGDTGTSAPASWLGGIQTWQNAHVVLSLWVHEDPAVLEAQSEKLRAGFAAGMTELLFHDATALPDNHVHFGYRDNIAQPTVIGAPPRKHDIPDDQPPVPTGEFLLGYTNAGGGVYSVQPSQLSTNSSYAAFRILEQDVVGFEQFLQDFAPKAGVDPEMLAAKVCGRWRNGNPLELMPTEPGTVLPNDQLNDFTYVSTTVPPDDTLGLKCPIGSHIRRTNPRNMLVTGTDSTHHRITRRAMPYGPAYDPANPVSVPRGLIGYFINASVFNQFQFIQGQWALTATFVKSAKSPGGQPAGNAVNNISGQDVFLGDDDASDSSFTLPVEPKNQVITGFPRLIDTRGGAYVFFPSITGLNYLATLPASTAAPASPTT
jgi:deferrochelatase/peroxidase EfeB